MMKSLITGLFGVAIASVGCAEGPETAASVVESHVTSPCGPIPKAPVCNNYQPTCTSDAGWVFWPNPEGTACTTSDGNPGMCDGGDPGPPNVQEPLIPGECTAQITIDPRYYVVTVIYSPPGRTGGNASTVSYGQGSTFSTQTSSTHSFKQGYTVKASLDFPLIGDLLGSTTVNGGYTLTSSTTDTLALKRGTTTAINHSGPPVDGIDHDEDEIYLLLNPRVYAFDLPHDTRWTLDVNPTNHTATDLDIQYVKIAWLNGTQTMPAGVAAELAHHGITAAQYPNLLANNPFANGNTFVDPAQFVRTGMSFPYEPPTVPNGTPDSFPITFTNEQTATTMTTQSHDATVGITASAPIPLPAPFRLKLEASASWTWTRQSTSSTSSTATETASAMIRGPSYGYTGPTNVTVYYDTMNKTFMFEFVRTPAPVLRGRAWAINGELLVHEKVFLRVGEREYQTVTNRNGEFRFFDQPAGAAEVRLTNSDILKFKVTKETQTIDLKALK